MMSGRHNLAGLLCVLACGLVAAGEPDGESSADIRSDALESALQDEPADALTPLASEFTNAQVTLAVIPRYPKRALKRKIDGEVTLAFEIAKHGRARNIRVAEQTPSGVFDDEAIDAMKYWAFSPARLALCGTAMQEGKQTFVFDHDADPQIRILPLIVNDIPQLPRPIKHATLEEYLRNRDTSPSATAVSDSRSFHAENRVQPDFPLRALDRRKEGMVALFFLIEADGSVSNVKIIDAVNGSLFGRPSLQAIRQWDFEPRMKDGRPMESAACHEFIFHVDEYKRSGKLARQREESNVRAYTVE